MKGYKIAIGVDTVTGPFLCMVELETLEESIIVEPTKKVNLSDNAGYNILTEAEAQYYVPEPRQVAKYRTNMAKVVSVKPLENMPEECWNKVAYSIWNISTFINFIDAFPIVSYKAGQMVSASLNVDKEKPCGEGIHFFASEEDAKRWVRLDPTGFVIGALNYCHRLWESTTDNFVKELCK